jgi:SH3 domain-containing protein
MSQSSTPNEPKPISLRPRPGETELNWREWLMLAGVALFGLIFCAIAGRSAISSFANAIPSATATAPIVRPTVTLIPTPTSAPTFTPTPDIPASITVGVYVVVVGGVNFRNDASTGAQIIRTLGDGEVLQVTGGPTSASSLTWWKLKDQNGSEGWAVADYLKPTAAPR